MCGIAGFFLPETMSVSRANEIIQRMQKSLWNRGPDGKGAVLFDGNNGFAEQSQLLNSSGNSDIPNSFQAGLVHTRLSILDLSSAGSQPMTSPEKRYWIVYNGEVYNFKEIQAELKNKGYQFKSNSDTEVVLYSWIEWGVNCLQKFNGMFSFVIYDRYEKDIFCVRDRIGIKPFYYYLNGESFLFSSDVTTLIASGLYEPKVNWAGIYLGMAFQGSLRPFTVYEGVHALLPGHYMHFKMGEKAEPVKYWDLPINQHLDINENDAEEELHSLLKKSVQRCLVSDVDVATLMSGGVDSSTLSAIASLQHNQIKTFTLTWDEQYSLFSELEQAKATAKRYPMQHIITHVDGDDLVNSADDMLWLYEEPIGFFEPHYPVAKHVNQHNMKVALLGLGPDELLCGYNHHEILKKYWLSLKPFQSINSLIPGIGKMKRLKNILEQKSVPDLFYHLFSSYVNVDSSFFSTEIQKQLFDRRECMKKCFDLSDTIEDPFQCMSYVDMKVYIGTHHNHTTDRFLMNYHVEGRLPFLDHELVEFCFKLPHQYKIRGNEAKYLLRKIAARYIDPSNLKMKKQGFVVPEFEFINGDLKQCIVDRITRLQDRDFFHKEKLQEVISNMAKDISCARTALYFSNFELWYEWFIERQHPLFQPVSSSVN